MTGGLIVLLFGFSPSCLGLRSGRALGCVSGHLLNAYFRAVGFVLRQREWLDFSLCFETVRVGESFVLCHKTRKLKWRVMLLILISTIFLFILFITLFINIIIKFHVKSVLECSWILEVKYESNSESSEILAVSYFYEQKSILKSPERSSWISCLG